MPLREFELPNDIETVAEVLPPSFQYPENEAWSIQDDELDTLADQMATLRRFWPVFRLMQWVVPPMRDMLRGYVWEEDGKPVGLVNILRRGTTDQWLIGNVSVLPEYRRRGIARQLVEATITYARNRGADRITLDVIDGNVPAYNLYTQLGFEHFSGQAELNREANGPVPDLTLPDGYRLEPRSLFNWRPVYELAQRITPETVERYEPVEEGRFRQPQFMRLFVPLIFTILGGRQMGYLLRRASGGQVVGSASLFVRRRKGGLNRLTIMLDPGCAEAAPALVHTLLREIGARSPGRKIEASPKHWQQPVIEAMEAAGFQRRTDMHTLGIICETR